MSELKPQTQTEIRKMLKRAGVAPNRRRGQCFLIDGNLMRAVVAAGELTSEDAVLEVGTGTGSMTRLLAAEAGEVLTIEVDSGLARIAGELVGGFENVTLMHADVLAAKSAVNPDVLTSLRASVERGRRVKLVANLPYAVATSLLVDLVLGGIAFERLVFVVQQEVADRLTALPGTRDYGWVTVLMTTAGETEVIRSLPADAFWPKPQVSSALVRFVPRAGWTDDVDVARLCRFGPYVFQQRRKTIGRVVRNFLGKSATAAAAEAMLAAACIDGTQRADRLTPAEIVRLSKGID